MNRCLPPLAIITVFLFFAGCDGGTAPEAPKASAAVSNAPASIAQAPQAATPAKQPAHVAVEASPDQVVTVFLNAIRSGDEATTGHLLTDKARQETAKAGYSVAPQSAPNTSYKVAPAVILPDNPNGAHVTSTWTEAYQEQQADGSIATQTHSYDVVWVLRREQPGWRVAGMAIEIVPGEQPAFMNFEDPADMDRKYQAAVAAEQAPAPQAQPGQEAGAVGSIEAAQQLQPPTGGGIGTNSLR